MQQGKTKKILVTMAEFARHIGVNRSTIGRMARSGALSTVDGKIDLKKSTAEYQRAHDPTWDLRRGASQPPVATGVNAIAQVSAAHGSHGLFRDLVIPNFLMIVEESPNPFPLAESLERALRILNENLSAAVDGIATEWLKSDCDAEDERCAVEAVRTAFKRTAAGLLGRKRDRGGKRPSLAPRE